MLRLVLNYILLLTSLHTLSNAAPSAITIESVWHPQCPFELEASISPDFSSLSITYITRNATPNSLVAFGQDAVSSKRKCYATVNMRIIQSETLAHFYVSSVEMQGSAQLDKELVASIETAVAFDISRQGQVETFPTTIVSGPLSSNFTRFANCTDTPVYSSCNSFVTGLYLINTFEIFAGASNVSETTTGELVKNGTLKFKLALQWSENCEQR